MISYNTQFFKVTYFPFAFQRDFQIWQSKPEQEFPLHLPHFFSKLRFTSVAFSAKDMNGAPKSKKIIKRIKGLKRQVPEFPKIAATRD